MKMENEDCTKILLAGNYISNNSKNCLTRDENSIRNASFSVIFDKCTDNKNSRSAKQEKEATCESSGAVV